MLVDSEKVKERLAKVCEDYSSKKWDEYKRGFGPGRADPHWQGQSDGATDCADAIRQTDLTDCSVKVEDWTDLIESLSAQVADLKRQLAMLDRILTVDVALPPGTVIHAGCKLRTVLVCLAQDYRSSLPTDGEAG